MPEMLDSYAFAPKVQFRHTYFVKIIEHYRETQTLSEIGVVFEAYKSGIQGGDQLNEFKLSKVGGS